MFNNKVEIIELDNGNIEKRYWSLSSISKHGKVVSVGRQCSLVFVEDKDGNEVNIKPTLKKKDAFFTEDIDFYNKITGVDVTLFIGLPQDEFYNKIKENQ